MKDTSPRHANTYLDLDMSSCQERAKSVNLVLEDKHISCRLVLIDGEIQAVLLNDLDWALHFEAVELRGDLALLPRKDLKLSALKQVVELRDASDKVFKKCAACLNKLCIVVVLHFHIRHVYRIRNLLGNRRDVAARPTLFQSPSHSFELIEASLAGPLALRVAPGH